MSLLERTDLAWCEIDDVLIFLDLGNDRYFRLSDECNRSLLSAIDSLGLERCHQPTDFARPQNWMPPARVSSAMTDGSFHLQEIARAFRVQRRIERRLASRSFASVIMQLKDALDRLSDGRSDSSAIAPRTIRAFEHSRLLRTAADRCLPQSIALAFCLAASGVRANVVIGVKLAPFGAHCWAQLGDEVLNDSVEEVLRYRPILII